MAKVIKKWVPVSVRIPQVDGVYLIKEESHNGVIERKNEFKNGDWILPSKYITHWEEVMVDHTFWNI